MSGGQSKMTVVASVVASAVADDIEARIRTREFQPYDLLPDPRALANEYGVWFETMQSAAKLLVIRELVTVAPSLALRVTGHALVTLLSVPGRQRRLRSAIDREAGPLLEARDRGDKRAKEHLRVIGALLVRRGLGHIAESDIDVGGLMHDFRILVGDADGRPGR